MPASAQRHPSSAWLVRCLARLFVAAGVDLRSYEDFVRGPVEASPGFHTALYRAPARFAG